jgi:alkylation response protein AidB-like acyl-CoA dehydrogenase
MLDTSRRSFFREEHHLFRDQVRRFLERELVPHLDRWEEEGIIDRAFWTRRAKRASCAPPCPKPMAAPASISASTP